MAGTRSRGGRVRWALALATAGLVVLALADHDARAADAVSACFAVHGAGVAGVVTAVEARTPGGWRHLGPGGVTSSAGCVRLVLPPAWRDREVRLRGALLVGGGEAVTTAATSRYARGGHGSVALGTGLLGEASVPLGRTTRVACGSVRHTDLGCWLARNAGLPATTVPSPHR